MRIRLRTVALFGVLGVAVGMVAAAFATSATPQVSTAVENCHRSAEQPDRFVVFVADAHAVAGARTMAIRFDLQRQRAGERWHKVHAAGLGEWHRSEAGVDIFRYRKLVTNLAAPANYRATARFRWYDGHRAIVARARRLTSVCRQTDPRPDLLAADLAVEPGPSADRARYVVTLRNAGRRPAGAFEALVYIDGVREGSITVPDMAGRARQAIAVEGKRCGLGSTVLVVLDPADRIDESRESNNTTRFACPL